MFKKSIITGILGLFLLSAGLLLAQSSTVIQETDFEAFECTTENLTTAQTELAAQIEDFDAESDESLKDLYVVGKAYQAIALACGYIPDDVENMVINTTETERITNVLTTLSGDPLRGQLLYNGEENAAGGVALGCAGCHVEGINAPKTEGTWTRWDEVHSQESEFEGFTFEDYAIQSIIHPWDYSVEGFPIGTMPNFYHTQMSYQDLADIIAYLNSQDQLIEE